MTTRSRWVVPARTVIGSALIRSSIASVARLATALAVAAWLGAMGLFQHYDATRPTNMRPAEGRVLAQLDHGHIVYLTRAEQAHIDTLEHAALLALFAGT